MNPTESAKDFTGRSKQFFLDVRNEMKKVTWPTKQEVMGTTMIVVAAVFFFGLYLGLVDYVLTIGLSRILTYFRG